ncbi:MAG: benzoate-CoA ligase family protein [Pseudomonadota bacterium]
MTSAGPCLVDPVGDTPAAREIGFDKTRHTNASAILFDNLKRDPDAIAVLAPGASLTYRALCHEAGRWAAAFAAYGCERGERIAFFLDDTPVLPAAFFGALYAGFVPVLLNTLTRPDLLNYYLSDMQARLALCDAPFLATFDAEAVSGTGLEAVIACNGTGPTAAPQTLTAENFLGDRSASAEPADTGPDDMAFWMYSSGSTGRPKGILHLHHDMAYTAESYAASILKLTPADICFSVPKVFFAYGLGNSITFPFQAGAASLLMPGQPKPAAIFDAIAAHRPTVFFGLPTLYTALTRAPEAATADLSSLRLCVSAAETLSADIFNGWKALSGLGPVEGLGSTEVLHIYLSNTETEQKLGSAGKRVPGYEVSLRDADGNAVPVGEEGVLWVRGDSNAPCYWNRPDKTAETMRGDWIYTGDRFVEDADGFFTFQGRADDLIKVSGQWVYPLEVERCLAEHPAVHECAVLAHELADKRLSLRAIVRLCDGIEANGAMTADLQDFVKAALVPYKYPRFVTYVSDLPKTGTGKIDRQALKEIPVAPEPVP